jgi:hypothetical protein
VNRYSSLLQLSVPTAKASHVTMVGHSDQKARIIAEVKNIDVPMLTRGAHIENF